MNWSQPLRKSRSLDCARLLRNLTPLDFITTLAPFGRVFWCCNTTREPGKEPTMLIIGCDFHAGFQQVAMFDRTSGEISRRRLQHPEEARAFYAALPGPVLVGLEACGKTQWFEQMLAQMRHELWIGN